MIESVYLYSERESNPHGPQGPQDFKSGVSTYSTIRAWPDATTPAGTKITFFPVLNVLPTQKPLHQ